MLKALGLAFALAALVCLALRDQPHYPATRPWIAALLPITSIVQISLQAHKAGLRVGRYAFTETFRILMGFALGEASPFIGLTIAAGLMALREGVWLAGVAKGGVTSAARQKAWLGYGVPVAGSPLVMAAYERGGKDAAAEEARGLVRTLLLIGVPAAAGIALVARPLGEAMIGEAVREQAIAIMPWIAASGLLNGLLIHYFAEAFQLARRTRERAILMRVPAKVSAVLNFLLIPFLGLMGAVVSTLVCYVTGLLLLALAGRRHVGLPLPVMEAVRIGLAALAMWPVIAVMPALGGWPELILKAGAGAITYGVAALVLDAGGARTIMRNRRG
ncbi:polysaccharide biosynthesis C-terminal domain-containing protein [Hyphomonas sp.]|uniref:polysaccharide biosynthesis C-terminal domain-containing protein n=1 Tax=Hyphomonas sp. TaxID=87 RepID=UPI0025B7AE54|nr:polysaccharide biosynthesis C-terminal domain-containing protein [Hyphomonas sp.]MBI1399770.1 hypothetical protein [Hyphomonas sp.]